MFRTRSCASCCTRRAPSAALCSTRRAPSFASFSMCRALCRMRPQKPVDDDRLRLFSLKTGHLPFFIDVPVYSFRSGVKIHIPIHYKEHSTILVKCKKEDFLQKSARLAAQFPLFSPIPPIFSPTDGRNCRMLPLAFSPAFGYTMDIGYKDKGGLSHERGIRPQLHHPDRRGRQRH